LFRSTVLVACPVILVVSVMSAPLMDAPLGPVTVPETLPVEDSWAKASDEITRRTAIAPVHRINCLKVERAQPVLRDIRLAYLPCSGTPGTSDLIRLSQQNLLRQPVAWGGDFCPPPLTLIVLFRICP